MTFVKVLLCFFFSFCIWKLKFKVHKKACIKKKVFVFPPMFFQNVKVLFRMLRGKAPNSTPKKRHKKEGLFLWIMKAKPFPFKKKHSNAAKFAIRSKQAGKNPTSWRENQAANQRPKKQLPDIHRSGGECRIWAYTLWDSQKFSQVKYDSQHLHKKMTQENNHS